MEFSSIRVNIISACVKCAFHFSSFGLKNEQKKLCQANKVWCIAFEEIGEIGRNRQDIREKLQINERLKVAIGDFRITKALGLVSIGSNKRRRLFNVYTTKKKRFFFTLSDFVFPLLFLLYKFHFLKVFFIVIVTDHKLNGKIPKRTNAIHFFHCNQRLNINTDS